MLLYFRYVTIVTNMRYNKIENRWKNVWNPILSDNVIVADEAKILGPVIIEENTVVGAGTLMTKDIPANSIAFGANQYKPKKPDYDYFYNQNMVPVEELIKANEKRIAEFDKT